ncbi:dihydropteroate synthase [Lentibacillus halophilus]|uniref:Dihydropteroate synthase n=1 Tax=Lentibacillus halophilus TaxID=295065 RepID=A0ABP3J6D2_9BACI
MKLTTKTKTYDFSERTHVMGILNVTPDSFSDGGHYTTVDQAVDQAVLMEKQGADIIDIGGESTRPTHQPVSLNEEVNRVIPVIQAVKRHVTIPISIDTYKAETARQALAAGADIINDVWGAKREPAIAQVAAEFGAPIILMHNRTNKNYTSIIDDMKGDLQESIDMTLTAGVHPDNIILDPGIGFAKTSEDNVTVMHHLEAFTELGYPLLLGTSRKSFIGNILHVPSSERDNGTGATTCLGIVKGAQIVRVHDVALHVELATMMDAMLYKQGVSDHG